ncbi:hypothetical protein [Candidatus Nitrosocosmicus sp. SS]|jgi:hypothetical protein|uniref:hypothetical protein n=1 Tax=Candidatus Nitrosocosmicus agrestis TaxID=2563600 RepID=UPI00122E2FB3|nr:hypothetical protein [Candidatus Nitrosocosmicus sp. SS]KAA2280465.1 hypothetical protein F1Z66_10735 [Candidatus Nitrosocosmicus sp. SS]KAF0869244.1 hypothetical protein E5N71_05940 [Candidatus Nitrosocosmicus sp. SS]
MVPDGLQVFETETPFAFFFYKEEKSIIERTVQYIKDRTKCIDDYFPCKRKNCKLKHARNWLNLFVNYHNKEMINAKLTAP